MKRVVLLLINYKMINNNLYDHYNKLMDENNELKNQID